MAAAAAAARKKNCVFCKSSSQDQNLGTFYVIPPHKFHSNCLIFSWHIRQNKDKTKGLKGFEKNSIDYALNEAKNQSCTFCKKKGATLKCSGDENTTCEISFHLPCALKSKITLHEYFGRYKSYCLEHISRKCRFDNEPITGIACIVACCNQLYSHDECLEGYVIDTKSQLKCPLCERVEEFVQFMKENYTVEIRTSLDTDNSEDESFDLECAATSSKNRNRNGKFQNEKDMVIIQCSKCKVPFGIHKTRANVGENNAWRCQKCNMEEDQSESEDEIGTKRKRKPQKLEQKKKKK